MFFGLAAVAATFNLVCTGTSTSESMMGKEVEPYSYEYRFDLAKGVYCEGECKATRPVKRIDPTTIYLSDETKDNLSSHEVESNRIDRETGSQSILYTRRSRTDRFDLMIMKWQGQCEKRPFTGFPAFETKF